MSKYVNDKAEEETIRICRISPRKLHEVVDIPFKVLKELVDNQGIFTVKITGFFLFSVFWKKGLVRSEFDKSIDGQFAERLKSNKKHIMLSNHERKRKNLVPK